MLFPERLKKGDVVGLIATSSPADPATLEACITFLENMGFVVKVGKSVTSQHMGYLAGDDLTRANDVNAFFMDKEIKGIFCLRGGYGSCRIMDKVDWDMVSKNPKFFIGYSDVTNLHVMIQKKAGFVTFHGPMVFSNAVSKWDAYSHASLLEAMEGPKEWLFKNPPGDELVCVSEGAGEGELVGGNLAILVAGIGTPYEVDTDGKIFFIEEVGESTYRVDRMLHQLLHAGKFKGVKGILLGDFTDCLQRNEKEHTVETLIDEILAPLGIPVIKNIRSGHGKPMATLPMGAWTRIDTQSLTIRFHV